MTDSNATMPAPQALDRRAFIAGGLALGVAGIAATRVPVPNKPRIAKADFEAMVPKNVGDWTFETASGLVLPPEDALSDRLYDNLITRIYSHSSGSMVMLLIAYNNRQDGVLQIHRPEICYPAGGYKLSATRPKKVAIASNVELPCKAFSAIGNERSEQVLYWTRIGDTFPQKWSDQRLAVLRANLAGNIPDGLLVRVSASTESLQKAMPIMEDFVASMHRASPERLQNLLFHAAK
jgi:EpsI family protein